MGAKIRRTQDNLYVLGTSVIVFGMWNLLKFTIYFFVSSDEFKKETGDEKFFIAVILLWSMLFISFLLRCVIGFSARAEGKGKRKSVFYLVLAGIIALVYCTLIAFETAYFIAEHNQIFTSIVTLIIDVTSLVFLIELMVNSIRIRKLRKDVSE